MKNTYFFITSLFSLVVSAQTITQSNTQTITDLNSVSCSNTGTGETLENHYYRDFDLASFGITGAYGITEVQFGIQSVQIVTADPTIPVTIKLYSTALAFPASFPAGYTEIGSVIANVAPQTLTILNVPITGTVPAGEKLVVEVFNLDLVGAAFAIGSNADGQLTPSYIVAPGCGITNPTDIGALGFPDMHLVLNVVGTVLGVNDYLLKSVGVYPNPSKDIVAIQLPDEVILTKATIMDNTGKVFERKVSNNTISIADFATGIYFLTLQTDKGIVNKKIVKI